MLRAMTCLAGSRGTAEARSLHGRPPGALPPTRRGRNRSRTRTCSLQPGCQWQDGDAGHAGCRCTGAPRDDATPVRLAAHHPIVPMGDSVPPAAGASRASPRRRHCADASYPRHGYLVAPSLPGRRVVDRWEGVPRRRVGVPAAARSSPFDRPAPGSDTGSSDRSPDPVGARSRADPLPEETHVPPHELAGTANDRSRPL